MILSRAGWLRWAVAVACLTALSAPAAPTQPIDDVEKLLQDQGVMDQLSQMRQSLSGHASDLVGYAMGFLGVPYRRGGSTVESGFDCSGFVRAMFEQTAGKLLPRKASQQAAETQKIDKHDLQPGDLVFFNTMRHAFSHVGIYVGDNKFIHSPKPGQSVRIDDLRQAYWQRRFDGARRVPAALSDRDGLEPVSIN
jgi:cell wall-associated NlpC family hydrolase